MIFLVGSIVWLERVLIRDISDVFRCFKLKVNVKQQLVKILEYSMSVLNAVILTTLIENMLRLDQSSRKPNKF